MPEPRAEDPIQGWGLYVGAMIMCVLPETTGKDGPPRGESKIRKKEAENEVGRSANVLGTRH